MNALCEFCKKEFFVSVRKKRFCSVLCQRKHYNRRPEIREKCRIRMHAYRKDNPEWREKHRLLQAKYKEKRAAYRKYYFNKPEVKIMFRNRARELRKTSPEFVVADRLRRSLRHALDRYSNTGKIKSSKKYGLDWKEVIEHLKPFPKDMHEYEIDHIVPLHTFDLNNSEEIKEAFSPTNLQWLTKMENRSKGGKVVHSIGENNVLTT